MQTQLRTDDGRQRLVLTPTEGPLNPKDKPTQSRGQSAANSEPLTLSGLTPMTKGILPPIASPATLWVIEGNALDLCHPTQRPGAKTVT
ncbi:MAG: hypothetical protein ACOH2H_03835 [Cypionkella sp.]